MGALYTALGGAIERHADGWRWRDGTPEPRVRDMQLRDIAPGFRCITFGNGRTYVEIPAGWRQARYWPGGRIDTQAANVIDELIRGGGQRSPIYAEGLAEKLDDHRLTTTGCLVDAAQWDAAMTEHCGAWWDKAHEADILARATEYGAA